MRFKLWISISPAPISLHQEKTHSKCLEHLASCWIRCYEAEMLRAFRVRITTFSMGYFLMEKIFRWTHKEFWCHILSGCQVCNWGTQYHLCSIYRGSWRLVVFQLSWLSGRALVAQWQSTGGLSQRCPGFNSWWLWFIHDSFFPVWGKMFWAFKVISFLQQSLSLCLSIAFYFLYSVAVTNINSKWWYMK